MKKISELTATTTANTSDVTVINNGNVTKKITIANLIKSSGYAPFKLGVSNGKYGYYKTDGTTFVEFSTTHTAKKTISAAEASTYNNVDMGASHNYRYIDATAVYNKGKSEGATTHTTTKTVSSSEAANYSSIDLGTSHTYRYVNATTVYNAGIGAGKSAMASVSGPGIFGFSVGARAAHLSDGINEGDACVFLDNSELAYKTLKVSKRDGDNNSAACLIYGSNSATKNVSVGSNSTVGINNATQITANVTSDASMYVVGSERSYDISGYKYLGIVFNQGSNGSGRAWLENLKFIGDSTAASDPVDTNSNSYKAGFLAGSSGTWNNYNTSQMWGYVAVTVPPTASKLVLTGVLTANAGPDPAHPTGSLSNGSSVTAYRGQTIYICNNITSSERAGTWGFT